MMSTPGQDESLISRLLALSPAERAAVLRRLGADDPSATERPPARPLVQVKTAPTSAPDFSSDAVLRALESALDLAPTEVAGTSIGPYKLLQEIGEGGFGVVWMAEQALPIRRHVAIKIIKSGMDTKEVIARFEAERQALALMDHPNIARVFDAGATSTGRPYFVMELVRGVAITRYCDDNRLTAAARLRLFMAVCHAVQHAHQKGVIHRDLKPSNVLVTLHDGVPVPKIIDFGIAKATGGGRLTDKTLFTELHAFIGTPAYTSPEQMEMSGLDVDTRSDIYSLGVLLYELLTGQPPFDPDALAKSGLEAMRRTIRETDPPRPSHRLGTLSREDRLTVAQQRGTDGARLSLLLRGDLDWIVMHCLEKDRTRRYETASGLARDIQCHLENEPVAARPPSSAYRLQKFIHRHKAGFAAAAAISTALIAGLIVSSLLFLRERVARERAVAAERIASDQRKQAEASSARANVVAAKNAQIAQFMRDMLAGVGPAVARGRDTIMLREILDQTAKRLASELEGQPEIVADLQSTLGSVYRDLGQYAVAEELVRQAVAARRAVDGNESAELAAALDSHGVLLTRLRRWQEAEAALQEALALRRKLFGHENAAVAETLLHLSYVPAPDRTQAQTEALRREVLAMRQKLFGPEHPAVAEAIHGLALAAWARLDVDGSIALHREALAMRRKLLGDDHPAVTESRFELGFSLEHGGKIVEAGETYREAFFIQRKVLGDGHPQVLATLLGFAGKTIPDGKTDETIAVLREFIAGQQKLLGGDSPALGPSWLALACLLDRQQRGAEEARALVRNARRVLEKARTGGPALDGGTIASMSFFAWSNLISGTPADGLAMGEEALKMAQATFGQQRGAVQPTRTLAWLYLARGRWSDAVQHFEATVKLNRAILEPTHVFIPIDLGGLAVAYREAGRLTEARHMVEEGLATVEADQRERGLVTPAMAAPLFCEQGLLFNREGRFAEAEVSFRESLARYDQRSVQFLMHRLRPKSLATIGLAEALRAQGRFAEAEILVVKAVEEASAMQATFAGDRNAIVRDAIAAALQIYTASGKTDQADRWRARLRAL